jgi:2',3'-cyclic-nucleotide 2'-phosphodiesterase (5'-nucleotidase family)
MEKLPHMTTLIKQYRKDNAASLLLDAGDWASGTPVSNQFQGKPMIEIMNAMGYDAACVEESDLVWGLDTLLERAQEAEFPLLAANLALPGGNAPPKPLAPYAIKFLENTTVGIIGVTLPDEDMPGVSYLPVDEILEKAKEDLKEEGVDFFILLSHLGHEADRDIASRHPWIHVILGGHSHTMLSEPAVVGTTLIGQSGWKAENLGVLGIELE